jgi:hypothetical protein
MAAKPPFPNMRPEVLHVGCLPVWTNAPPGLRLCVVCGAWKPEAEVTPWEAACAACRGLTGMGTRGRRKWATHIPVITALRTQGQSLHAISRQLRIPYTTVWEYCHRARKDTDATPQS